MSANQGTPDAFAARWQKLNEIFAAAQELDPERQNELLELTCGDDEALRKEAAAILAANRAAQSQGFLHADVFAAGARVLAGEEIASGTEIGDYNVIREIGRGGMGAVYLAERTGFHQQVALKIIKRGMDTDEIIRRFVRERDVLASLNHPNIARLLDGGHTTEGLPFIAMEYVEGETITAFCDQRRLAIEDRIELFRKVCRAIAYAHHNLVVHRDIKPSNILVGADGEPKLLDFGIAKLLAPDVFDNTVDLTAAGANLMTPDYASPEQIRGERVTTASDIYSLGVLLYELLSGHRPFHLKNRPSIEMLRIVSEQEPRAPSDAATMPTEKAEGHTQLVLTVETLAQSRNERPARLQKRLRGDLDNIVLTALRKDPLRRYSSVEEFSADLERHLLGLPVTARPATLGYRLTKFAQRNLIAVVFASVALLALLGGLSISIWQTRAANKERARAEQRFNEVRKMANTLVSGWDKDIPESLVSNQVRGRIADISTEYLDNLARETDDPALLKELARAYTVVGYEYTVQFIHVEKARSSFHKAEAILRRLIAAAPDDVEAKRLLADCLGNHDGYFGERDPAESLKNRLEIVLLNEEILAAKPDDLKAMFDLGNAYAHYGGVFKRIGRRDESVEYFTRASEIRKRRVTILEKTATTPDDHAKLSWTYMYLAGDQANQLNEFQAAEENLRRAAQIADTLFTENSDSKPAIFAAVTAHHELGLVLKKRGDIRGSLEAFRKSLDFARIYHARSLGEAYFIRKEYDNLLEIAEALHELGNSGEALAALRESLDLRRKLTERGKDALRTYGSHAFLVNAGGKLLTRMKRFDEALAAYQEAERSYQKVLEGEPDSIGNRRCLATLYLRMGDFAAGLGVCGFERSQPYKGISGYEYCPPDANDFTRDRARVRRAQEYYQKAVSLFNEFEAQSVAQSEDKENLRLAREKLATVGENIARRF